MQKLSKMVEKILFFQMSNEKSSYDEKIILEAKFIFL